MNLNFCTSRVRSFDREIQSGTELKDNFNNKYRLYGKTLRPLYGAKPIKDGEKFIAGESNYEIRGSKVIKSDENSFKNIEYKTKTIPQKSTVDLNEITINPKPNNEVTNKKLEKKVEELKKNKHLIKTFSEKIIGTRILEDQFNNKYKVYGRKLVPLRNSQPLEVGEIIIIEEIYYVMQSGLVAEIYRIDKIKNNSENKELLTRSRNPLPKKTFEMNKVDYGYGGGGSKTLHGVSGHWRKTRSGLVWVNSHYRGK